VSAQPLDPHDAFLVINGNYESTGIDRRLSVALMMDWTDDQ